MAGRNFRVAGSLDNTDRVMNDTFWIGLWPGLTEEMLEFVTKRIGEFMGVGL
jgi:CDP-6-deoxy-D-xylo-4-hexulose-3-dehydrase